MQFPILPVITIPESMVHDRMIDMLGREESVKCFGEDDMIPETRGPSYGLVEGWNGNDLQTCVDDIGWKSGEVYSEGVLFVIWGGGCDRWGGMMVDASYGQSLRLRDRKGMEIYDEGLNEIGNRWIGRKRLWWRERF